MKRKCVLLDLDLQFGTSSLALDLEPGHGLRDVVSSPQRVDNLMIAGAMINESDMFSVLSAEEAMDENIHIDNGAIAALLKEMRASYGTIIVDLPRHHMATQKRLLSLAHEIVIVTEMTLVGIRDTLRIRTSLKSLGYPAAVTVVASKVGAQRPAAVDEPTFSKGAQCNIDFTICDDHKNITAASNAGKVLPMVASDAQVTKNLRALAKHVAGMSEGEDKTEGGWLKSFLSGKKGSGQDGSVK
jgi:pilus assembly protein CpaE